MARPRHNPQAEVSRRKTVEAGYKPERDYDEWRDHWDRYPEMYIALWAVVCYDCKPHEVNSVIKPHYNEPPEVEDWVVNGHIPRQRRYRAS